MYKVSCSLPTLFVSFRRAFGDTLDKFRFHSSFRVLTSVPVEDGSSLVRSYYSPLPRPLSGGLLWKILPQF